MLTVDFKINNQNQNPKIHEPITIDGHDKPHVCLTLGLHQIDVHVQQFPILKVILNLNLKTDCQRGVVKQHNLDSHKWYSNEPLISLLRGMHVYPVHSP